MDAQAFPGNSGGPIVSRAETLSIAGTPCHQAVSLIGILNSYIPYEEHLFSGQTGKVRSVNTENSGLTYVFPVDFIKETIEIERERFLKNVISDPNNEQNAPATQTTPLGNEAHKNV